MKHNMLILHLQGNVLENNKNQGYLFLGTGGVVRSALCDSCIQNKGKVGVLL